MTNRQLSAAKTRERLIEAARQIICEKGLTNTSVDEITSRCGVAKGTFYTYFKRKEDIVFELSRGMFAMILENAKAQEGGFLRKLSCYMVSFAAYIEQGGLKLCQEWVKNVVVPELVANEADREKLPSDIADIGALLHYGIAQGALRADMPVLETAQHLADLLYGEMLCWCIAGGAYSFAARTQAFCAAHLFDLFQKYLSEGDKT